MGVSSRIGGNNKTNGRLFTKDESLIFELKKMKDTLEKIIRHLEL